MSERRVQIPEHVEKTALETYRYLEHRPLMPNEAKVRFIVEAALKAIVANPQPLTDEQKAQLAQTINVNQAGGIVEERIAEIVVEEFQRRFLFAPAEPEDKEQSFDTPFGKFIVDARVPPGEIRLEHWSGPTLIRNIGESEPEDPLGDLKIGDVNPGTFVAHKEYDRRLEEALNRGDQKGFERGQQSMIKRVPE